MLLISMYIMYKCLGCDCKDNSMCSSGKKCEQCKCIRLGKLCLTDLESLNLLYSKLTFIDCECEDGEDHMCGVGEVCHNCHCLPKGKLFP